MHAWVGDDLDVGVQALERLLGVPVSELERKLRLVPRQREDLRMQQTKGQQLDLKQFGLSQLDLKQLDLKQLGFGRTTYTAAPCDFG
jgi:hypothetical protein